MLHTVLLGLAFLLFLLAALNVKSPVNLTAAGLALLTAAFLF